MTRKILGIEEKRTRIWCGKSDCLDCIAQGSLIWSNLETHVYQDHGTQELCMTCFHWIEDEEWVKHLTEKHFIPQSSAEAALK